MFTPRWASLGTAGEGKGFCPPAGLEFLRKNANRCLFIAWDRSFFIHQWRKCTIFLFTVANNTCCSKVIISFIIFYIELSMHIVFHVIYGLLLWLGNEIYFLKSDYINFINSKLIILRKRYYGNLKSYKVCTFYNKKGMMCCDNMHVLSLKCFNLNVK